MLLASYINKRKDKLEYDYNLIEYLAVLISYDRKGTMEIIKKRRAALETKEKFAKEKSFNSSDGNEHFNTTFYDDIMKQGGPEAVKAFLGEEEFKQFMESRQVAGDEKVYSKVELSEEDIEFLTNAVSVAKEYEDDIPYMPQGDTIILP